MAASSPATLLRRISSPASGSLPLFLFGFSLLTLQLSPQHAEKLKNTRRRTSRSMKRKKITSTSTMMIINRLGHGYSCPWPRPYVWPWIKAKLSRDHFGRARKNPSCKRISVTERIGKRLPVRFCTRPVLAQTGRDHLNFLPARSLPLKKFALFLLALTVTSASTLVYANPLRPASQFRRWTKSVRRRP